MQWIIGLIVVIGLIGLAVYSLVKDKKSGRTSCGCGCANCASCRQLDPGSRSRVHSHTTLSE